MIDNDLLEATAEYEAAADGTPKSGAAADAGEAPSQLPERIGRYGIKNVLGKGGFGLVYLAHDEQLSRPVAIKVPHRKLVDRIEDAEAYLTEARTVANLDHPYIVPVFDVGSTEHFPCFIVSKYIDGTDLASRLKHSRLSVRETAELVARVAEALHYAHTQGLVHRDIKPGNILLDTTGKPFVADFGLALREWDVGTGPRYVGTAAYMSPEQARGEGHRVDGRSDIFSLGVVLYELLVGRRPFRGESQAELMEQVTSFEPRPPRQYDDSIPKELDRICLKALSKRASERYSTATDIADDLRHFLSEVPSVAAVPRLSDSGTGTVVIQVTSSATDSQPIRIVPKGLRSFDEHDADFFLELLPGPRDREGLPDSLRFWKTRIEEPDPDKTFAVGLIYGPSGCGKSSLVKAGLLPRLSNNVIAVYIEATAEETETRLLNGLRKRCPALSDKLSLKETLAALRRGLGIPAGKKMLIVLDQFEQWLHASKEEKNSELVQALRQCDGEHVQCVLMVRDDFWLTVSRFLQELEIRLVEGHNSALSDLFDADHARKVLAAFGRAFGKLPEIGGETSNDQKEFLKQAVSGLAQEGKVISVRLALFADMIKSKVWTSATLKEVGGTEGVGVTFLEETFTAATAPPQHRLHQQAARAVLKALLPESGTDIKGHMRSYAELLDASGYANRLGDFDDLVRILDSEVRLITPTDPEGKLNAGDGAFAGTHPNSGVAAPPHSGESGTRFYQLTHDYLVHSLRGWLTSKQKETWRGRAELVLEERAAQWTRTHDSRFLLSVKEYLAIHFGVPRRQQTAEQQALMQAAGRRHGLSWGGLLVVALAVAFILEHNLASIGHSNRLRQSEALVEAVLRTSPGGVPYVVEELRPLRDMAVPMLRDRFADTLLDPRHRLHAAVALAAFDEVEKDFLLDSIATAPASEGQNVLSALLRAQKPAAVEVLARFRDTTDPQVRLRLAMTLLHLGDASAARELLAYGPDPADRVAFILEFASWRGDLTGLPAQLRDNDDPALRSGLCAALGMIPPDQLDEAELSRLQVALTELYAEATDGGTHSAAGWALKQWGVRVPNSPLGDPADSRRRWFVNHHGMTLLAITPGTFIEGDPESDAAGLHPVTLTRPFFLGDSEVTLDQFRQFLADSDPAVEKPASWAPPGEGVLPSGDCPVVAVSWEDALLFCNWLSRREGRRLCYRRAGEKIQAMVNGKSVEYDVWRCDFDADGYRLPSEAEWEYTCRAGTSTPWAFGDDDRRLGSFGVYRQPHAASGGAKLPNNWGLFDMHGNAREWCWDAFEGNYPSEPARDPCGPAGGGAIRLHRGGSWWDYPHACRSGYRNMSPYLLRDNLIGFRVACGVPARLGVSGGAPSP